MRRTKAWFLLVFGFDGERRRRVPADAHGRSREGRSEMRSAVPLLILMIRLLMAIAVVLGLVIQIIEIL